MTTGRINQVATSSIEAGLPFYEKPHIDVRYVGVESNCVLASVSQLSCTTALLQRQSPVKGSAGIAGSAVPALWDSISTRNTAEARHQVRGASFEQLVKTIHPYNSNVEAHRSSGDPDRTQCVLWKSKKRNANSKACESRICLMPPQLDPICSILHKKKSWVQQPERGWIEERRENNK